jgi:4'-phosphopantetheinyl transferase
VAAGRAAGGVRLVHYGGGATPHATRSRCSRAFTTRDGPDSAPAAKVAPVISQPGNFHEKISSIADRSIVPPLMMDAVPTAPLALPHAQEVHLWQLYWPALQRYQATWWTWLSTDEHDRANHFLRPRDRDRFVMSRGGLRYLLARYLQCSPPALTFAYSPYGKPSMHNSTTDLHFNLAHSGDWVIYGVSRCAWVGVDVEQIAPRAYLEALIRRCLTAAEQATLPEQAPARLTRFLAYWAAKEAHLKAIGLGLNYPMSQVQIMLEPTPVLTQPADLDGMPVTSWSTHLWSPGPGAIAALCVGESLQQVQKRWLAELGDPAVRSGSDSGEAERPLEETRVKDPNS